MSRKPFASTFLVLAAMLAIGSPGIAIGQVRGADPAANQGPRTCCWSPICRHVS